MVLVALVILACMMLILFGRIRILESYEENYHKNILQVTDNLTKIVEHHQKVIQEHQNQLIKLTYIVQELDEKEKEKGEKS